MNILKDVGVQFCNKGNFLVRKIIFRGVPNSAEPREVVPIIQSPDFTCIIYSRCVNFH